MINWRRESVLDLYNLLTLDAPVHIAIASLRANEAATDGYCGTLAQSGTLPAT
jgi:hypothetical protein